LNFAACDVSGAGDLLLDSYLAAVKLENIDAADAMSLSNALYD
jgi:bifunctional ADP-heptose synthase (sugar kinase/adenylyltransferase)